MSHFYYVSNQSTPPSCLNESYSTQNKSILNYSVHSTYIRPFNLKESQSQPNFNQVKQQKQQILQSDKQSNQNHQVKKHDNTNHYIIPHSKVQAEKRKPFKEIEANNNMGYKFDTLLMEEREDCCDLDKSDLSDDDISREVQQETDCNTYNEYQLTSPNFGNNISQNNQNLTRNDTNCSLNHQKSTYSYKSIKNFSLKNNENHINSNLGNNYSRNSLSNKRKSMDRQSQQCSVQTFDNQSNQRVFDRLYQDGRYKQKIQNHIEQINKNKVKNLKQQNVFLSQENQDQFLQRQREFLQKKEEKLKEKRRIQEFQKELELLEFSRQQQNPSKDYYSNQVADEFEEANFEKDESQIRNSLIERMQIDVERRRLKQETAKQMKEYQMSKDLKGMFVPKINKQRCSQMSSVSKERRDSNVYQRLNEDSQRRKKSIEIKRQESQNYIRNEKGGGSEIISQKCNSKSSQNYQQNQSRSKSRRKNVLNEEQKLRQALIKGVSAIELWKLTGDENGIHKSQVTTGRTSRMSPTSGYSTGKILQQQNFGQALKTNTSYKQLSAVERKICEPQFIQNEKGDQETQVDDDEQYDQDEECQYQLQQAQDQPLSDRISRNLYKQEFIKIEGTPQTFTTMKKENKSNFMIEEEAQKCIQRIMQKQHKSRFDSPVRQYLALNTQSSENQDNSLNIKQLVRLQQQKTYDGFVNDDCSRKYYL